MKEALEVLEFEIFEAFEYFFEANASKKKPSKTAIFEAFEIAKKVCLGYLNEFWGGALRSTLYQTYCDRQTPLVRKIFANKPPLLAAKIIYENTIFWPKSQFFSRLRRENEGSGQNRV